eukprot:TRINITY_DN63433_c0_g1_i1.p1 TRINITY_DN63433_c0_g1~~TRINITY_DN63433_c0_g1_i1.p1  ORF type:complete len:403 (-),score=85.83 TRINITY_DN63433_c0_g1_i1:63-1271(-)
MNHTVDVAVVGGGISGLNAAANLLEKDKKLNVMVLEGSSRLGGRIYDGSNKTGIDLGPAWMWLGVQPHLSEFVEIRGIEVVAQAGGSYEYRAHGGLRRAVEALEDAVKTASDSRGTIKIKAKVQSLTEHDDHVEVALGSGEKVIAKHVLLAAPPAKVAEQIAIDGAERYLTLDLRKKMQQQPIWMAQAGKVALLYKNKFWRADSVFGRLPMRWMQQSGVEFGGMQSYDGGMTTDGRDLHALVSFVMSKGISEMDKNAMAKQVAKQLHDATSIPLDELLDFEDVELKFWRADLDIQTKEGQDTMLPKHPDSIDRLNADVAGRRIWFANSEASTEDPGMLEGAIENSQKMANTVLKHLAADTSASPIKVDAEEKREAPRKGTIEAMLAHAQTADEDAELDSMGL